MRWAVNIAKRMLITVSDIRQGRNTTYTLDVVISCVHRLAPEGHPVELTRPTYGIAGNSYQKRTLRAHDNRRGD